MGVAVVVPWRGGCPHRERALTWLLDRLDGWSVVLGEHTDGEWCKAAAVADGLAKTDADMIVIHDADVWVPNLDDAVANCRTWAIPHLMVRRLTEASTERLYLSGKPGEHLDRRPYKGFAGGGVTVVRRHVYDQCPLDHRFVGWGQEDASWALALETLYGKPWRGNSDLLHLWHPPQPRVNRQIGSEAGRRLHQRYRNATRHPNLMRAVLAEAHASH